MTELKIMKAPTEQAVLEELNYPIAVSMKLDGIRCLIKNGEVFSASMRKLPNIQLRNLLRPLLAKKNLVFDGELYGHELEFDIIKGTTMAHDRDLPEGYGFHVFDMLTLDEWNEKKPTTPYEERYNALIDVIESIDSDNIEVVPHTDCESIDEVKSLIEEASEHGYEGIMLRAWDSPYRHSRATVKQALLFKYKFWIDFDAKILSVHEMMGYKDGIEREKDPTGRTKATYKKEHMEPKGTFGYFEVEVDMPGKPIMHIGAWKGLDDPTRDEIWRNKKDYPGQWISFRAMEQGQKDLPRIPRDVRFREPK